MIISFLAALQLVISQDPNDAFINQSIAIMLNGQQKHYYDGNVVVHSSSKDERNDYFDDQSDDDEDGTPEFNEPLQPYDYKMTVDLNDIRVSRIYADVNKYQVDPPKIPIGNISDYAINKYLGDGTFAFVQSAVRISNEMRVVLKQIKTAYTWYARVEAQILFRLNEIGNKNIVKLVDIYTNDTSPVLVFEELQNCKTFDFRLYSVYHDLTAYDIKNFFYKLFKALADAHSRGIMHLDIKPANIIVTQDDIQLIDWGVSDFYFPMKEYRTRVGTRHYRAPEQLIHYKNYDYSVDVWALGSIFASAVFKKYPFFNGKNNDNQLLQVVKVLGTQDFFDFCSKYNINISNNLYKKLYGYKKVDLEKFITDDNKELATPDVVDLLRKIFVYDHAHRISAAEILDHKYFFEIVKQ